MSVGDAYQMDCRYCDIQVEITKRAYAARCPDPVGVLDYISERMKASTRPRVDIADMKRTRQVAPRQEESMSVHDRSGDLQQGKATEHDGDVLTTAAKAIGATLGKLAVKTGMAKPPAAVPKVLKKVASKKKAAKKESSKKSLGTVKRAKPASKRKRAE
jgi:hypothetical protein